MVKKLFKNKLHWALIIFITLNIFLSSWYPIHGDIYFHTDIARDFLLIADIVDNANLTLIGPRSSIPGLFHGPLWLYIQVPAYILSAGQPSLMSWFWVILTISAIAIIYFVAKELFDKTTGLISALIFSTITISYVKNMFNPFGALMLTPIFFYYFYLYVKSKKPLFLVISIFILGIIIQFQIAFGFPILFLSFVYIFPDLLKRKRLSHILSYFVIIIPLSTYILFELRNSFFQLHSVLKYIFEGENSSRFNLQSHITDRLQGIFIKGVGLIEGDFKYMTFIVVLGVLFGLYKYSKKKALSNMIFYKLVMFFYLGFWALTIPYAGKVWGYYYLPFLPLFVILLATTYKILNRYLFIFLMAIVLLGNYYFVAKDIINSKKFIGFDSASWKFNQTVAKTIFDAEDKEFGYFIFSPDQYGYTPRYALDLMSKTNQERKVYPFQKKKITYLILLPPPDNRPDLDWDWWIKNKVGINIEPISTLKYENGTVIKKYLLSPEEIKIESDPNMIHDLYFR